MPADAFRAPAPYPLVLPSPRGSEPAPLAAPDGAAPLAASAPEPAPAPDAAESRLLRGALDGDAACWSALIARHNRRVVVALLARGAALDQAKDLAQETWLRLIESQRAGRLSSLSLPGLAIVQAGYLLRNAQRSAGRLSTTTTPTTTAGPRDEGPAASPDPAPLAEDLVLHRDRVQRLAGALASCPATARSVFEFVYDHPDLPYTDVAARFGLSTQRIKQTVCEVRKRLRAALLDEET